MELVASTRARRLVLGHLSQVAPSSLPWPPTWARPSVSIWCCPPAGTICPLLRFPMMEKTIWWPVTDLVHLSAPDVLFRPAGLESDRACKRFRTWLQRWTAAGPRPGGGGPSGNAPVPGSLGPHPGRAGGHHVRFPRGQPHQPSAASGHPCHLPPGQPPLFVDTPGRCPADCGGSSHEISLSMRPLRACSARRDSPGTASRWWLAVAHGSRLSWSQEPRGSWSACGRWRTRLRPSSWLTSIPNWSRGIFRVLGPRWPQPSAGPPTTTPFLGRIHLHPGIARAKNGVSVSPFQPSPVVDISRFGISFPRSASECKRTPHVPSPGADPPNKRSRAEHESEALIYCEAANLGCRCLPKFFNVEWAVRSPILDSTTVLEEITMHTNLIPYPSFTDALGLADDVLGYHHPVVNLPG